MNTKDHEMEKLFNEKFYEGENNSVYCAKHRIYATPFEIKQFLIEQIHKREEEIRKEFADNSEYIYAERLKARESEIRREIIEEIENILIEMAVNSAKTIKQIISIIKKQL
jgi:hypothetical protein